jgi:hypothetical protein
VQITQIYSFKNQNPRTGVVAYHSPYQARFLPGHFISQKLFENCQNNRMFDVPLQSIQPNIPNPCYILRKPEKQIYHDDLPSFFDFIQPVVHFFSGLFPGKHPHKKCA